MRRIGRLGPSALLAALCVGLAAPAARAQVVVAPGDTLTVPPDALERCLEKANLGAGFLNREELRVHARSSEG